MSRVLVTGASGFIGRPTVAALLAAGHEVHVVDQRPPAQAESAVVWHEADLLAEADVIADVAPELLVHLAWYAEHGRFWTSPENLRWVEASLRLLREFAAAGGRRALITGTCAEYAWGGQEDLSEAHSRLAPATLYGVSKDALRRVAQAYCEQSQVELAWARMFFLYGPGEAPGRLVPAVVRPLLAGEPAQTTAGSQIRDFMYVQDAGAALARVLDSGLTGAVNVASGRPLALAELITEIGRLAGRPELVELGARPTPDSEPPRIVADVSRLRDEVGFAGQTPLHEGIAASIRWWQERS